MTRGPLHWFAGTRLRWWDVAAFSFVVGTLQVLIFRYQFGTDVQVETLCQVYRKLDPAYLTQDFFVNASDQFGGRSYYASLLAGLCRLVPVSIAFFLLTWLSHVATIAITFVTARSLFRDSDAAGLIAAGIAIAVTSFSISGYCILQTRVLIPAFLALPWTLLAIGEAIRGRSVACLAYSLAAALVHPVGLEVGVIGLATVAIVALWEVRGGTDRSRALKTAALAAGCGVVLALLGYLFWIRPYAPSLDVERLRGLYAYLRVPHHIVPSTFPLKDWGMLLVFLVAGALMGYDCYIHEQIDRRIAIRCAVATGVVLVICATGYIGVEIIPARAIITGNVYRLLYIVKWIGLMIAGGVVAAMLRARMATGWPWFGLALWAVNGPWHPLLLLGTWILHVASETRQLRGFRRYLGAITLVGSILVLARWGHREEFGALCVYGLVALWFLVVRSAWIRSALPILGCVALAGVLAAGRSYPEAGWSRWIAKYQPIIWLEDNQDEVYQIGRFVEANTRPEAVLLVPPDLARFRLTAERAVVVDFKAFPFNDEAMEEWYQRVLFCYGPFESAYHHRAGQVLNNYLTISDERMAAIRDRYGATHAVLFPATPTGYPVLLQTAGYKVVAIPGGV